MFFLYSFLSVDSEAMFSSVAFLGQLNLVLSVLYLADSSMTH